MHRGLICLSLLLATATAGCGDRRSAEALAADDRLPAFLLDTYPSLPPVAKAASLPPTLLKRLKRGVTDAKALAPRFDPGSVVLSADTGDAAHDPSVPSPGVEQVGAWLMGQQFVFSRDLFGSARMWTVEPGEIARIHVGPAELDAGRGTWRSTMVVELEAKGCGLELEGSLRFYREGGPGSPLHLQDFTPTRRRRFGTCG